MNAIRVANLGKQHGLEKKTKYCHRKGKPYENATLRNAYERGFAYGRSLFFHMEVYGTWTGRKQNKLVVSIPEEKQAEEKDEHQSKVEQNYRERALRSRF